jgi:hypothetical protein
MSAALKSIFTLTIDRAASPAAIHVEDPTGDRSAVTLKPGDNLPYYLAIDHAADAHAELAIRLASPDEQPFDPGVTRDRDVLTVESAISDQRLETRDDTRLILTLRNRSAYYIAEDIHVTVAFAEGGHDMIALPDGNALLALIPRGQHVACIDPGQSKDLVFVAIARGPEPGSYPIDITVAYRLIYWDGRRARATFQHDLVVQSPDRCGGAPRPKSPGTACELPHAPMPRQPFAQRSQAMSSQNQSSVFAQPPNRHQNRVLKPIHVRVSVPGGGHLDVSYRLTKGNRPSPEQAHCCYGVNPDSKAVESYFSTQDTAAIELSLHNDSSHHLKHVRLTGIQLASVSEDGGAGDPVNNKLPDGNLLFEIVPGDLYFGHVGPGAKEVKYLSLITRGIKPGNYYVQMEVRYDIEQCRVPIDLGLTVNPD